MQRTIERSTGRRSATHSPADQTVNIDNAMQTTPRPATPKSFASLDTADHLLSNEL